jgi:predicted DCC family thiol-disulfide oxidoreductase YuxK
MNQQPVAPHQFALFRIFLGLYLVQHFLRLIPFGPELFSRQGMLPDPSLLPTHNIFPNILSLFDAPAFVTGWLIFLALASLLLVTGWQRRIVALVLWYGWASLLNRNIFISNPGLPYMGWILLALAVIPAGEPLTVGKKSPAAAPFTVPPVIFWGAWLLMGLGYTLSGIHKAQAPSWQDGTALWHVLQAAIARDNMMTHALLSMPMWLLKLQTWGVLLLEASFILWCFNRWTRLGVWLAIMGMHAGILMTVDFPDLTFGVLMIHLFTFDQRWFTPVRKEEGRQILFFDGVCGLCNHIVDALLTVSAGHPLKFAPLQGETAREKLGPELTQKLDTIVYWRDGRTLTKSTAVAMVLRDVGGFWALGALMLLLPRAVRNVGYDLVAANRYKLFGKRDACRMPTREERARFSP